MDSLLRDMPYFVEVARQKSFTKAADLLDVPISTLSRRIAALEKKFGVPLFLRTTRSVELTQAGKEFFSRAEFIVRETEIAVDRVLSKQTSPKGPVRLSVYADIYFLYMRGAISDFARQYPEVYTSTHFTTRWVDLFTEPYDLEIRVGPQHEPSLAVRRLATIKPGVYAAPSLLEKYPAPQRPGDLADMPIIMFAWDGERQMDVRNGDEVETIRSGMSRAVHEVNSQGAALELALAGLGFTVLVPMLVEDLVEQGRLVRLLPGWHGPGVEISVVMASSQQPNRIRLFVEHLVQHFADMETMQERFTLPPQP